MTKRTLEEETSRIYLKKQSNNKIDNVDIIKLE